MIYSHQPKRILLILFMLALFSSSVARADGWTGWMSIGDDYFEGTGSSHRISLLFPVAFHTCGWNVAANIELAVVGDAAFHSYSAVVLVALATGKQVSVLVSGCDSDRANVVAIRLMP